MKWLFASFTLVVMSGNLMRADVTLAFNSGTGVALLGNVSYAGGAAALVGTNIAIGDLVVTGAPMNNGTYIVNGSISCNQPIIAGVGNGTCGALSFTTGAGDQTGTSAGIVNVFASGGSVSITGSVLPLLGGGPIASGTLLTGSFTGPNTATAAATNGIGFDTKNAALLAFFGITDPNFDFAHATLDMLPGINPTNPFSDTVTLANFENTSAVPEPVSISLLGTVMLGCAALMRRRRAQNL